MGAWLQKSGMLNVGDLLTKDDFSKTDPTMSYPLSGLYNLFLINELGVDKYLNVYKIFSDTPDKINTEKSYHQIYHRRKNGCDS